MTRCTNRRTAILTLILGLTLLLCGCQVGGGVFVLPDISTKDSTQGKAQLLAALNQEIRDGTRSFITYTYGDNSAAEAVFLYLQDACNGDASQVSTLLAENKNTGLVNCAENLAVMPPFLSIGPCRISYSELRPDLLDGGVLRENADFSSVAKNLINRQTFLILPDDSSKAVYDRVSFAVGTIGGQTFVIAVFTS